MKSVIRPHGIVSLQVLKAESEKETVKWFSNTKTCADAVKPFKMFVACLLEISQIIV